MRRAGRRTAALALSAVVTVALAACSSPAALSAASGASPPTWKGVEKAARGETVNLWMYGGDQQGNGYVDHDLIPAAKRLGVTLKRVPIPDTKDALNRIISEHQAGVTDGSVDLVWVNGTNFGTGKQAGLWRCGWTARLPNMRYVDPKDPLVTDDFGTPVDGCEAPWHKAQFVLAYNAAAVHDPPTSLTGLESWIRAHPGRFTYPAPPDFTGSVFVREMLYASAGGYQNVPLHYSKAAYDRLTPALFRALRDLKPSLWHGGRTYPMTSDALDRLYTDGQVDFTMTYGPATLTELVKKGTFPKSTRVAAFDEGTIGNASFLGIPTTSGSSAGAMVVTNLALSPAQQARKADARVWGQFTVLDPRRLSADQKALVDALPSSTVVPSYDVLSRNANPELSAAWVPVIDDGWRVSVLAGR